MKKHSQNPLQAPLRTHTWQVKKNRLSQMGDFYPRTKKMVSMTLLSCFVEVGEYEQSILQNEILTDSICCPLCLSADRTIFWNFFMEKKKKSIAIVTHFIFLSYGFGLSLQLTSAFLMQICCLIIWVTPSPQLLPPQCNFNENNHLNRRYWREFFLK